MSTNGMVLLPRLYQLPQVARPNASIAFSGVPCALASGAVEAAPTYRRSPPLAVLFSTQLVVTLRRQSGSRGEDACSSSTLTSDWYPPWLTARPVRFST